MPIDDSAMTPEEWELANRLYLLAGIPKTQAGAANEVMHPMKIDFQETTPGQPWQSSIRREHK